MNKALYFICNDCEVGIKVTIPILSRPSRIALLLLSKAHRDIITFFETHNGSSIYAFAELPIRFQQYALVDKSILTN